MKNLYTNYISKIDLRIIPDLEKASEMWNIQEKLQENPEKQCKHKKKRRSKINSLVKNSMVMCSIKNLKSGGRLCHGTASILS